MVISAALIRLQPASHAVGPFRPGANITMVRNANVSSVHSPHPQLSVRDKIGAYEETQRDLRPS